MVEYILKIDIDESELVRKLNSAFSKAKMVVGGGSVSGGGGGGGSSAADNSFRSTTIKLGKSQIDLRNRYQKTFDAFSKKTQEHNSKVMTTGTVVKLAGLAVGVAGLMQMRKMVIDASPMLQAMLKLLNVGIMFILRPIGDFIGFVLRPLLIPFLKVAVQWYQKNLGFVISKGDEVGSNFAEGKIFEGVQGIYNFLTGLALGPDSDAFKEYEERQAAHDQFWTDAGIAWDKFWSGTTIPIMQLSGLGPRETIDLEGEEFKKARDKTEPIPGMYEVGDTVAKDDIDGKHYQIKLTEEIALSDAEIKTEVTKSNTTLIQMENWMAIEKMLSELALAEAERQTKIMEAGFANLAIDLPEGMQQTAEVLELLQSNATKKMFPGGGIGDADQVALLQQGHDAQVSYLEGLQDMDDGTDRAAKKIQVWEQRVAESGDMLEQHSRALRYNINELSEITASNLRAGALAPANQIASGPSPGGGAGADYEAKKGDQSGGPHTTPTTQRNDGGTPSGNIARCGREYGGGGMIEEEIFGVGKDTGKRYRFGESGDEVVIPYSEFMKSYGGGGGGFVGNQTQQRSVGRFTGISGKRYARYTSDLYRAQNQQGGIEDQLAAHGTFCGQKQEQIGTRPDYICRALGLNLGGGGPIYGNTKEYQAYLDILNPLKAQLTAASAVTSAAQSTFGQYEGFFSQAQTIAALSGQTDFESEKISANTTNLGGLTVNVSGVSCPDQIVAQIGPKILQYLQDNERRIGIR